MKNTSGLKAMEFNVLLKKQEVGEKTQRGLYLPQEHRDRQQFREQRAIVVDVSPTAFTFEHGAPNVQPGDEVIIAANAGGEVTGEDGQKYHVVKDKDVILKVDHV